MAKKNSHPYPHVGVAHPYSLSLSLRLSLAGPRGRGSRRPARSTKSVWPSTASWRGGSPSSARWPFLHHHDERRVGSSSSTKVAICFFTAGVSSHLHQDGPSHLLRHLLERRPLGHLHRWHHHVQVSSLLLGRRPLSLPPLIFVLVHCARCHVPWHADGGALLELTEDVQIWKAMSEYAAAPVSSKTEVVLDGGKEYAAIEAVEATRPHCSHCWRQSRRSHCSCRRGGPTAPTARRSRQSHCSTEACAAARGDPTTASNRVYLDGRRQTGPDLSPTCSGLRFFLFLKNDFEC
jgi:hypothetical protein